MSQIPGPRMLQALAALFTILSATSTRGDVIFGYVTDASSDLPIANAVVQVGNEATPSFQDTTDAAGYYEIIDVPADCDYTVVASAEGYISEYVLMECAGHLDFELEMPATGYLVETTYRGIAHYVLDGDACYRTDGEVEDSASVFPDIEATSPQIAALLTDIGAGTDETTVAEDMWHKCATTWEWLQANACYATSEPLCQEASDAMTADGWPSIQSMAETYQSYGFIPWGTCMSRAQIFTTLLYRVGLPRDRVAIAESSWRFRYSQHMYAIVYIANRWLFLDPSYISLTCPAFDGFSSIPLSSGSADYCHPTELNVIPGSSLAGVPEVSRRTTNSERIFIVAPPTSSHTSLASAELIGVADTDATQVVVNGEVWPVVGGGFGGTIGLSCEENSVTAEIELDGDVFGDSIVVHRSCPADSDGDGVPDSEDLCPGTPPGAIVNDNGCMCGSGAAAPLGAGVVMLCLVRVRSPTARNRAGASGSS